MDGLILFPFYLRRPQSCSSDLRHRCDRIKQGVGGIRRAKWPKWPGQVAGPRKISSETSWLFYPLPELRPPGVTQGAMAKSFGPPQADRPCITTGGLKISNSFKDVQRSKMQC